MPVRIQITDTPDRPLRDGMSVSVSVDTGHTVWKVSSEQRRRSFFGAAPAAPALTPPNVKVAAPRC